MNSSLRCEIRVRFVVSFNYVMRSTSDLFHDRFVDTLIEGIPLVRSFRTSLVRLVSATLLGACFAAATSAQNVSNVRGALGVDASVGEAVSARQPVVLAALPPYRRAWIDGHDLMHTAVATTGVALISIADTRVAAVWQLPALQRHRGLERSADVIQTLGTPGALLVSASLYATGAATGNNTLADASLHATEAVLVTALATNVLKLVVGRARPNATPGRDAHHFLVGRGYRVGFNSFPSGHTSAAFAAASVFGAELDRTGAAGAGAARPVLYGVASLVGAARMYNDRHWLSDVVAGALLGHAIGRRIVSRVHPHE